MPVIILKEKDGKSRYSVLYQNWIWNCYIHVTMAVYGTFKVEQKVKMFHQAHQGTLAKFFIFKKLWMFFYGGFSRFHQFYGFSLTTSMLDFSLESDGTFCVLQSFSAFMAARIITTDYLNCLAHMEFRSPYLNPSLS